MPREKYRVHEVAKDFGLNSKKILSILETHMPAERTHMAALEDPVSKIKNVVLLGHGRAGKTSLSEAMLFCAGHTERMGCGVNSDP